MTAPCASAQFLTNLQADTPEEFDAYLEVLAADTPEGVIAAAEAFEQAWPLSELRAHVYYKQLESYQALDDAAPAIAAGEKALEAAPDNLMVLAALASILPNETGDAQRLARAEECANRILLILETFRLPRSMAPQEGERSLARIRSSAHASLGMVAHRRGEPRRAVREFEAAVSLAPEPDPVQHYRLGLLYEAIGDRPAAIEKLRQAARFGDPRIGELARQRLRNLQP